MFFFFVCSRHINLLSDDNYLNLISCKVSYIQLETIIHSFIANVKTEMNIMILQ